MRETCLVMLPGGICGKPAVDYLEGDEIADRFWMCAEHWDAENNAEEYDDDDLADDFEDF